VTIVALLLTALATGYGAAMVMRSELRPWAAVLALLCYLLAGVQLALLFTLGGSVLLPGRQLNPAIVAEWQQGLGGTPLLSPWLTLVTLLAHLIVLVSHPDRTGFLRPLPATIVFLALMMVARQDIARGPSQVVTGVGPDRIACLTMVPMEDGAVRMLFAEGAVTSSCGPGTVRCSSSVHGRADCWPSASTARSSDPCPRARKTGLRKIPTGKGSPHAASSAVPAWKWTGWSASMADSTSLPSRMCPHVR
jgi:hypothetical protein